MNRLDYICIAILVLCSIFATILKLGDQCLWQDEAQTALISKTILTDGIPKGTDGRNSFSQTQGAEMGPGGVWYYQTWLPFYVLAGFFALFGTSTFVARLPFALFGAGTIVLMYFLGRSLWNSRRAGMLGALLLLGSIPFLILVRQCRYYSPEMFFCLLVIFAYFRVLDGRKRAFALLTFASILLFHSHYLHCAVVLAALTIHSLAFHRAKLKWVLSASVITALLGVPWIVQIAGISRECARQMAFSQFDWSHLMATMPVFTQLTCRFIFPLSLLLLIPIVCVVWRRKPKDFAPADGTLTKAAALLLFVLVNLVIMSQTAPQTFVKNLDVTIPAICLIMALMLEMSARIHWGLLLVGVLACGCNQPLGLYAYELTHHYHGPIDGIVDYLNHHGRPTDKVAITYGDLPLKFYTRMRVVGGLCLTPNDIRNARTADWIIIRKYAISDQDAQFKDYLTRNVDWSRYKSVRIDYPDTPFENREDPRWHLYWTSNEKSRVIICRRVR